MAIASSFPGGRSIDSGLEFCFPFSIKCTNKGSLTGNFDYNLILHTAYDSSQSGTVLSDLYKYDYFDADSDNRIGIAIPVDDTLLAMPLNDTIQFRLTANYHITTVFDWLSIGTCGDSVNHGYMIASQVNIPKGKRYYITITKTRMPEGAYPAYISTVITDETGAIVAASSDVDVHSGEYMYMYCIKNVRGDHYGSLDS